MPDRHASGIGHDHISFIVVGAGAAVSALRFSGRTVLITGASSGLGAALSSEFAAQGAAVVLAARRLDRLEAVAARIRDRGGRALVVVCDVTREEDLLRAMAAIHAAGWVVDTVVANAGFGVAGRFSALRTADYQRQFDTNVFGVVRTVRAALADLQASRGSIVIVGSIAGHIPMAGISAYGMSKFALRALAGALRGELRSAEINVTLISPGFLASEFRQIDNLGVRHPHAPESIPAWLLVSSEQAARTIVRAVYRRRGECVVTGHGRVLVWLYRHMPWLVEAVLRSWRPTRKAVH